MSCGNKFCQRHSQPLDNPLSLWGPCIAWLILSVCATQLLLIKVYHSIVPVRTSYKQQNQGLDHWPLWHVCLIIRYNTIFELIIICSNTIQFLQIITQFLWNNIMRYYDNDIQRYYQSVSSRPLILASLPGNKTWGVCLGHICRPSVGQTLFQRWRWRLAFAEWTWWTVVWMPRDKLVLALSTIAISINDAHTNYPFNQSCRFGNYNTVFWKKN